MLFLVLTLCIHDKNTRVLLNRDTEGIVKRGEVTTHEDSQKIKHNNLLLTAIFANCHLCS